MTVMIMKAKEVLMTLDYMETKMYLGEKVVEQFNVFNPLNETCDGLRNAVIRGNTTKAEALEELSKTLAALDTLFTRLKDFYSREPTEGAYDGCLFAIGDAFNDSVHQIDLEQLILEATNRDQGLMMRVKQHSHSERYPHLK